MGEEVDHHHRHHHEAPLLPIIEFPNKFFVQNQEKSEEWRATSNKVRKACEDYGCFVLVMQEETMPTRLREEMVKVMTALFDLPEETKQKHTSPTPYQSYRGKCDVTPLYESFGVDNACRPEVAEAFTHLMWPQGNSSFCDIMKTVSSKLTALNFTILEMLFSSLGAVKHYPSHAANTTDVMRLMKYVAPPTNDVTNIGLPAHTDKSTLTVLCQNDVHGLEVQTKQGEWIRVSLPERGVVVLVGDALKAWSNGRLHAVTHRVKMGEDNNVEEDRYSFSVFVLPKEEAVIEVPEELVDDEHPLMYRPFKFSEYYYDFSVNPRVDAMEVYAGV